MKVYYTVCIIVLLFLVACINNENNPQRIKPTPQTFSTTQATKTLSQTGQNMVSEDTSPVPTLSIDQADALLSELLTTNGGCDLPCWWGVNPGVTTEKAASDLFLSLGMGEWVISGNDYRLVNMGYSRLDDTHFIPDIVTNLYIQQDLVEYVHVSATKPKHGLEDRFTADWQKLSLAKILNQYGIPAYVRLEGRRPSGSSETYILGLSYPSRGIEVNYIIEAKDVDTQQHLVCPDFDHFIFITLNLYKPDKGDQVPGYIISNHLGEYRSWKQATGSDLTDFYETYRQDNKPACIHLIPQ